MGMCEVLVRKDEDRSFYGGGYHKEIAGKTVLRSLPVESVIPKHKPGRRARFFLLQLKQEIILSCVISCLFLWWEHHIGGDFPP